jgi:glycosyltransferase involved in cell wall biosynthesis
MYNVIHVTHEAVYKVGGIGTVLEGLINTRAYRDSVGRTVLVCPLFYPENAERLGPGGVVEYSSLDQVYGGPLAEAFGRVEREFNIRIVYGQRPVGDVPSDRRTLCEVLLVDLRGINRERVNALKGLLWERFGIQSHRYEHVWEYEQYVELAAPAVAALEALRLATEDQPTVVFAHEFMGVPTALALQALHAQRYRTLFYAHEVAPIRRIVEEHPGHDIAFYNALDLALRGGLYMDQVIGPQHDYFKTAVVDAACYCDGILAVGHHVARELQFLGRPFEDADVHLAYNGVPVRAVTPEHRRLSRERIQHYCEKLLHWRPDLIFTHVTRLAPSKALWRDLDVLEAMDEELGARGQSAVLIVLSTELPRRPIEDVRYMEREWDWPLAHREGHPDLTGGEARYYQHVQAFNARARNTHVIYINQFGFSRDTCGDRVPADVEFMDLRYATDVELGLSSYEPFGISPFEPLSFGGLCVVSTSCGCTGFFRQASVGKRIPNVILADYIEGVVAPRSIKDALAIDEPQRRRVEHKLAAELAEVILKRLPQDEAAEQRLIRSGYELARRMSWDVVAERFVFPAVRRACARRRVIQLGRRSAGA